METLFLFFGDFIGWFSKGRVTAKKRFLLVQKEMKGMRKIRIESLSWSGGFF
jgi:hypothetical protein